MRRSFYWVIAKLKSKRQCRQGGAKVTLRPTAVIVIPGQDTGQTHRGVPIVFAGIVGTIAPTRVCWQSVSPPISPVYNPTGKCATKLVAFHIAPSTGGRRCQ